MEGYARSTHNPLPIGQCFVSPILYSLTKDGVTGKDGVTSKAEAGRTGVKAVKSRPRGQSVKGMGHLDHV